MATVFNEDFPIKNGSQPELKLVKGYEEPGVLHEQAFKGFSPDDDFDDILRKCGEVAQKVLEARIGKTAINLEDSEMIRLNAQAMAVHANEWAKKSGFDRELQIIDPLANCAIIGGKVLKLID